MMPTRRLFLVVFVSTISALTFSVAPARAACPSTAEGLGPIPYTGGVTFRVWAPHADSVSVAGSFNGWSSAANPLCAEGGGYWSTDVDGAATGDQFKYDEGELCLHQLIISSRQSLRRMIRVNFSSRINSHLV